MGESENRPLQALAWIAVMLICYIALAETLYRLKHPEQTETQLFLHIWRALTWQ